jgi:primosomal protein DnaI
MKKVSFEIDPQLSERLADELSAHPRLNDFFMRHDVAYPQIEEGVGELNTYLQERPRCDDCQGLSSCTQATTGYQPTLQMYQGKITLVYQGCTYWQAQQAKQKHQSNIQSSYLPASLLEASLADFRQDSAERQSVYQGMMRILHQMKLKEKGQGLYLHGPYQIGKTYALAALANEISRMGYRVLLTYFPDWCREIKSAMHHGTLESKLDEMKKVDVLMLDDFGGEATSEWLRDEIIGPILQHRLLDRQWTFFTSNLAPKSLVSTYTVENTEAQKIKALRLYERVNALALALKLT